MPELIARYFMPSAVVVIVNDGPELVSTTYWDSTEAANGFAFLSYNARTLRLLVPPPLERHLPDMTGHVRQVVLTRGQLDSIDNVIEVMFEDGSEAPFASHLDPKATDRRWTAHDERNDVENKTSVPCEIELEARLRLDYEIERLRSTDAA
jgi:hypothetical protein